MSFDLSYKLKGCEVLKELPPGIVKLYDKIENLRDNLGNLLVVMKPLPKLLKCKETPKDKFGHGFKGKKIVHGEEDTVCYFCGKVGHETQKCKDLLGKGNPSRGPSSAYQHPHANKVKGPKKIWVPKSKFVPIADPLIA